MVPANSNTLLYSPCPSLWWHLRPLPTYCAPMGLPPVVTVALISGQSVPSWNTRFQMSAQPSPWNSGLRSNFPSSEIPSGPLCVVGGDLLPYWALSISWPCFGFLRALPATRIRWLICLMTCLLSALSPVIAGMLSVINCIFHPGIEN